MAELSVQENIALCKKIAKEHDDQAVVVVRVQRDGTINVATYGEDKHKCDIIGEWAQKTISDTLPRIPFEPVFGWGNGGAPKYLEMREYMGLTPGAKVYYDRCAKTVGGHAPQTA